ncbi:hypothetical protein L873DRAFT_602140 [Choiromyces venosus 120613-1]|uniref:Uncharacterized protein n=1 Tax=Choiromyces venosus 120613-1 TaxID=1336337 RepID=A0A3N4K788_9PEZI|nr:hypothetical protein L873DRAFT_602140 [Choiromyces venosus 120613-1]
MAWSTDLSNEGWVDNNTLSCSGGESSANELPEDRTDQFEGFYSFSSWFKYTHSSSMDSQAPKIQNPWHTFPCETFAILYTLVHSQETMFSRFQLETIWAVLHQLCDRNIPSLSSIKRFKKHVPSPHVFRSKATTSLGEPYFHISLCDLVRMESATPSPIQSIQEIGQIVSTTSSKSESDDTIGTERQYKAVWSGDKWCNTPTLQLPVIYHRNRMEIWFGDIVEFMESESCMRGWGICQVQVEVVNDHKEEIYLKISRLKQIEPGVLLFSLQHNTLNSTKKTELHPLQAIQSVYNPTSQFPPPQGYRTIVIEVGELHTTDNLPSINSHTLYEIMSSEEIDHYFSVHPVKKTRDNFDPQIAVRQLNVNLWQDGLSRNRTKKWNPHECTLLSFPGLVQ